MLLLSLAAFKGWPQQSENIQNKLIERTIRDWVGHSQKTIILYKEIRHVRADSSLLYSFLLKEGLDLNSCNISKSNVLTIDPTNIKKNIKIVDDKTENDSLQYLYWLVNVAVPEHFIGISDSAQRMKTKCDTKINFIPIELGTPFYWRDYAVISILLGNSKFYYLYRLKEGEWTKISNLMDPRWGE